MKKVEPLRDYVYGTDALVVADMDKRDRGYVVLLQKKLNELCVALADLGVAIAKQEKEFEQRVTKAEKTAADKIYKAAKEEKR